ncbi:phosphatase PAP2 family protein [Methanobrevibacter sp.]|uniref:phosphatase PAP2 family protein n=1 Tax=Methanobrevibacter sp. TaxID=66852 RepID=UPI0038907E86
MNINVALFYFINRGLENPFFDLILPQFTNIGGFVGVFVLCTLSIIIFKYYNKEKYLKIAKSCLYALLISAAIALCLKLAIVEKRPFEVLSNVHQLVIPSEPNSFPSGHCSSTFSVITILIHDLWENKAIVILLAIFCVLIAFSRVYCGVHYPSDVVVGAMVGILSGILVLKLKI